jgi:hypothetical protein
MVLQFLKKMNTIQFNKLSRLHNGKTFFFTKTDYLYDDFKIINSLNNEVVLVSGNSDYCINQNHINALPKNVKIWFATNAIIEHPKIINLPLGIENFKESIRDNHGIGYDRVKLKDNFILNYVDRTPTEFMYSNFTVMTNTFHRTKIKNISQNTEHITWEEPNLEIDKYFNRILDFEAVICAQGNGDGDNHRIYETLYLNRIPITFNSKLYELLHKNFPIICLDNPQLLQDYYFMREKINQAKLKKWDRNLLNMEYWEYQIISQLNTINFV